MTGKPSLGPPPSETRAHRTLGFGRVPGTPEEARAHLQERVRAFIGLFAAVWTLFFFAQLFVRWAADSRLMLNFERGDVSGIHLGCATILATTFLLMRRSKFSLIALGRVEILATLLQAYGLAAMIIVGGLPQFRSELSAVLGLTNILAARAALVPSNGRETVIVGGLALAPMPFATWFMYTSREVPEGLPGPIALALFTGTWCIFAVVVALTITRVIYGLERSVRQANTLGQYTLEDPLGEGSMGQVFRARHALLRRPTAIKLLPPEKSGADAIKRFEREVQLTSELSHPNIVAIYDYGQTPDGIFYYAMEYLEGTDLDRLVKKHGPLPAWRTHQIMRQVADALTEAHAIKLIHRDIKPANIVLVKRRHQKDVVKVLDFGLVKELRPDAHAPSLSNVANLVGTPLYVSPESITDPSKVDHRSDLYALGAVAYFLLTGAPWMKGKNLVEVCAAHLYETPEPPSKRLGKPVPASLEAIVLKCLAKDPAKRPQSAAEIIDALDAAADIVAPREGDVGDEEDDVEAEPMRPSILAGTKLRIDLDNRS